MPSADSVKFTIKDCGNIDSAKSSSLKYFELAMKIKVTSFGIELSPIAL
jgi:hypothetical protein